MTPSLETQGLTVRFGGHVAVNGVSCSFLPGTLTSIVGPNGAGKTTYFNLISGQIRATDGQVHLDGHNISRLSAAARSRRGIGRAFQLTNLFPKLTVRENVRLATQARAGTGLNLWSLAQDHRELVERADQILESTALAAKATTPAAELAHGEKRKLEIAILIALEPRIFMLDEPTAGMSVDEVPVILELIRALKARHDKTILLVEHKLDIVRELSDRIIVLHNGSLVADGDPASVMAAPIVQEAYLGVAA